MVRTGLVRLLLRVLCFMSFVLTYFFLLLHRIISKYKLVLFFIFLKKGTKGYL